MATENGVHACFDPTCPACLRKSDAQTRGDWSICMSRRSREWPRVSIRSLNGPREQKFRHEFLTKTREFWAFFEGLETEKAKQAKRFSVLTSLLTR